METLAVVEILGRRGEVVARERITRWPAVVGRAFDADVLVNDEYIAARHLRISDAGENFSIEDLGSLNGFQLIGKGAVSITGSPAAVSPGSIVRLGHTQIRIWRPDSPVTAELPSPCRNAKAWPISLAWFVLAIALAGLSGWLNGTGPGRDGDITFFMLAWAGVIVVWSGAWWLSDNHAREGTSFVAHAGIGSMIVALGMAGQYAVETLSFAFGLFDAGHWENGDISDWAAISYGVYRHLCLVSRRARWVQALIACLCVGVVIFSVRFVNTEQENMEYGKMKISSIMRPNWLRLIEGQSVDSFLDKALKNSGAP